MSKAKILVVLGQTSTGKSALAVRLAKKFNGEVISADSRQVYKGLDIGTGKITPKEMDGVPHHLLDVANLESKFSVSKYQKLALQKIKEILKRGKLPILCGGTGFYIDAVTTGIVLPEVKPNPKLRQTLEKQSLEKLLQTLKKLDKSRAENIDQKNKVRLIRAIEIAKALGKVPKITEETPPYEFIKIGLTIPAETLKRKIRIRLRKRLRGGMAVELYNLRKQGVSWKRLLELGFDQKYVALFLQKKLDDKTMLAHLEKANWAYAKRQWTWFKRDNGINWFSNTEYKNIASFVKNKLRD